MGKHVLDMYKQMSNLDICIGILYKMIPSAVLVNLINSILQNNSIIITGIAKYSDNFRIHYRLTQYPKSDYREGSIKNDILILNYHGETFGNFLLKFSHISDESILQLEKIILLNI